MKSSDDTALQAILRVITLSASLEARYNPVLASVHALSFHQFTMLLNVYKAPLRRMRRVDLASALSMGASSISHLTDPLEREGLLRRDADPRDARVVYVALTDAGAERVEAVQATLRERAGKLFDERWTDEDVAGFTTRLGQLAYGSTSNIID
ncbi:MAG TPA: MarR family transcriptional regulator [Hyphomicrobiaceae bacterium]|nr:MarR family transcriptional regulator [Hyphomicrobiaceae bacterium]